MEQVVNQQGNRGIDEGSAEAIWSSPGIICLRASETIR